MGDFNIHMNTPSDPQCVALQTIIDSCGLTQIIHEPTHRNGNTIDLVLVRGVTTSKVMILPYTKVMSNHYLIKFEVLTHCQQANNNNNCYSGRNINAATTMTLADLLPLVMAPFPNYVGSIDNLTNNFDDDLREIIDSIAPLKQKRAPKRRTPWFTEEIRAHKLSCRKLERKWRATKLEVFHQAWSDSLITYKRMLTLAKAKYYSNLIRLNKNDPKFLFSTVASLTQQGTPPSSSTHSADDFMNFFNKKIELIRKEIKDNASQLQLGSINTNTTVCTTDTALQNSLSIFDEITLEELLQRVSGIKQTTCLLDPLPGKLIKELFVLLGPSVLNIINLPLSSGTFSKIAMRFVKPNIMTTAPDITKIDFADRDNQKYDKDLYIGSECRDYLSHHRENCDLPAFFSSVRRFYSGTCSYMMASFPFGDPVLVNARFLDIQNRQQCKFSQVTVIERYPHFLSKDDRKNVEEEFFMYQCDSLCAAIAEAERVDSAWHEFAKLKDTATRKTKYEALFKVAKSVLVMYHSNADCERIFSHVNKN
ncbi:uncharacterized protein LOC133656385 [Entelurus aequoreus]|uniref:uncharacterized protein LOC133656385 n=1 Tax=Entelurus aequoreus TaxID=161455 RepID=UPI002B1D6438|nr:uncharacterized protein LOC133656385 [Entelurus aequoreus]